MSALLTGVGIGWRPQIAGVIDALPGLGFCEVIAESLPRQRRRIVAPELLVRLRHRGVPVVPHGASLSLGGAEPVDPRRVSHLAACAHALDAPLVSEHIAFVRAGGLEAGHLLPLPRTREALDALVANVRRTQAALDVPLALEPIAALFEWPDAEFTEAQFVAEILERTSALLVLDVANVYANARNRSADPHDELALMAELMADRIAYCHVAGGSDDGTVYHDTHTDAVPYDVLKLVDQLARTGSASAWMLERDGAYPPAAQLLGELDAIADAAGLARIT